MSNPNPLMQFASMTLKDMYRAYPKFPISVPMREGIGPYDVIDGEPVQSITTECAAFHAHVINLLNEGIKIKPQVATTLWNIGTEIRYCFTRAIVDGDALNYAVWHSWNDLHYSEVWMRIVKRFPGGDNNAPYVRPITWKELHEFAGLPAPEFNLGTYRAFRWDHEKFLFDRDPSYARIAA